MSGTSWSSPDDLDGTITPSADEQVALSLATETVAISKRVRRTRVRASRTTSVRDQLVTAELKQEHVVVERVAIGRVVDAVPPVRHEGNVIIMSVVEEEVVVVRSLVLKEEVHFRPVQTIINHAETVTLRQQTVSITRTPLDD